MRPHRATKKWTTSFGCHWLFQKNSIFLEHLSEYDVNTQCGENTKRREYKIMLDNHILPIFSFSAERNRFQMVN